MSFALLFHYSMLNMFRMLVHPSSGACDLFVIHTELRCTVNHTSKIYFLDTSCYCVLLNRWSRRNKEILTAVMQLSILQ